jgi:lipoprotein-releasing system ATP-binding protein
MNSAPIVLEARGITRHFTLGSQKLEVLRGIDLVVREGEMVSVMGMSGVGKSTLLHIIGLLDSASSGSVVYHLPSGPVEASGLREERRAALRNEHSGFVFQFYHLLPDLTVLENVLLPSMIRRSAARYRRERRTLEERARGLLERVGLSDRERQMPNTLSGGERQRVAISRALMNEPRLLLCDEPTGNLDVRTSEQMHELFSELNERFRTTFLFVTHDPSLARRAEVQKRMIDGRFEEVPQTEAAGE